MSLSSSNPHPLRNSKMNETTFCRCSSFTPIGWETVSHHKVLALAFPADAVEALDAKLKRTECLVSVEPSRFHGEQSIRNGPATNPVSRVRSAALR